MWFLVHVPGMNGANTRGLLGKGPSAPVTPAVFGPFIPRTYMLTQLLNHVSKEECSRGEYTKKRGPGRRKVIDGGLFGALNGAGAWTAAGAGVGKKNTPPRAIEAGARRFRGPGGPVTNTTSNHVGLDLLAPCRIDRRLATRMLESTPRFGVCNVAIHGPVS